MTTPPEPVTPTLGNPGAEMTVTRIAAVASIWVTGPVFARIPYVLSVVLEGGGLARHGESRFLTGYLAAATIASIWLALVFFRWKWKHDAGFGWLVILTVAAFCLNLVLAGISNALVFWWVPGIPVLGEDGRYAPHPPADIPILAQLASVVFHILTFPFLVMFLAMVRGLEHLFRKRRADF
ncbi:hypothetical protein JIN84_06055 [Luteolibacter yonseiensis]|uniref:Uncharacterized protein n=1 Tax=Luteolibacter yonseiensis TaxID=1144680 RepID=A0A934VAS0_9BACT|nr:hypothetical protein [Luteolibacter yonseiensis]MBK1815166.1 hypothetical protein [Luteolibacter yonseiensis]